MPNIYTQADNELKKLVRTDNGGATEATVYIDGVFEHRYNSSAQSQTITRIGGVATTRVGHAFGGLSGTTYELSNHLGSVNHRLDNNGSAVDMEEYYPFGDSSVRTWTQGSKQYRYVGKEKDAESGLYYYGARYYSAWTCRFISTDPLAWEYTQLTPYNYAGNKPINYFDIDGMQSSEDSGAEGYASKSIKNSDTVVTSDDENLIYNVSKNNRQWDYGVFNEETQLYELHCIADSTMLDIFDDLASERDSDRHYSFGYGGVSNREVDVANTINSVWRAEKIYNDAYADALPRWNKGMSDYVLRPYDLTPGEHAVGEANQAVANYYARITADVPYYPTTSFFGEVVDSYSGRADPHEIGNALLTLGFSAIVKGVLNFSATRAISLEGGRRVLTSSSDDLAKFVQKVPEKEGWADIVAHGDSSIVQIVHKGTTYNISHRELANYISKTMPDVKNIRLMSCNTGKLPNGFAQNLSNKLNVNVMAPTNTLWVYENGVMTIGKSAGLNTGSWKIFSPGG